MLKYNAPPGSASEIGSQMNTFYWNKKAIIEAKKEMYFTPLADVMSMPKHYGKEIKVYHYIPLLDDRNVNDQGIDANGVARLMGTFTVTYYGVIEVVDADAAAAVTAINDNVNSATGTAEVVAATGGDGPSGATHTLITLTDTSVEYATEALADAAIAAVGSGVKSENSGSLYGSSKDVGTITGRIPSLTEVGGRVNRVGFTRLERVGQITKFGFFTEFTQESFDFDSDEMLYEHLSRELVTGAQQLTEAVLQKDLLLAAGVTVYAGAATTDAEVTGEGTLSVVDYEDLMRLSTTLTDNRTPKQTKVITGSRMIDTKTINSGRVMYIGSELESTVKTMTDSFDNQAFVPVHQYADAGTIMNGEIGTVDQFRLVVVPEMLHWAGAGAAVVTNAGYRATDGHYDVYPMLVVGDGSFTTIGFQTDGKTVKFKITTKMPGEKTADRTDPYGETGFSSIKWYYGTLVLRSERLAIVKTIAKM